MKIKVLSARVRRCVEFRTSHSSLSAERRFISSRSLRRLDIPDNTMMFFFIDVAEIKVQFGWRVVVWSKPIEGSESPMYHYGELYSWARLHREFPEERSILGPGDNACAFRTIFGGWRILDKGNRVVSPETRKISISR